MAWWHRVFDLLELVADVEDRAALCRELAESGEQAFDLLRGQDGGRLVHDQELGVLKQAADDFDALTLADGQGVDFAPGVERQAVGFGYFDDAAVELPHVGLAFKAQGYVLQHGHAVEQREMLEHHADAETAGGVGIGEGDGLAVPYDLALVGVEHAVDDLDQRALAGAVLAEQRVDFSRLD